MRASYLVHDGCVSAQRHARLAAKDVWMHTARMHPLSGLLSSIAIHADTTRASSPRPQYIRSCAVQQRRTVMLTPQNKRAPRRKSHLVPANEPRSVGELAKCVGSQHEDVLGAQQLRCRIHDGRGGAQIPRPLILRVQRQVVRLCATLSRSTLLESSAVRSGDRWRHSLHAEKHACGFELLDLGGGQRPRGTGGHGQGTDSLSSWRTSGRGTRARETSAAAREPAVSP